MALSWILAAAVLGHLAYDQARAESILRWQVETAPGPRVWEGALGLHGFRVLEEEDRLHRILRSLPASLDDRGRVWLSGDRAWVAVHGEQLRIYGVAREKIRSARARKHHTRSIEIRWPPTPEPDAWSPMGIGWVGFEQVLLRIEASPPEAPAPIARATARREPSDPRAIHY